MGNIPCDHEESLIQEYKEALERVQERSIRRRLPRIPRFARNDFTLQLYVHREDDEAGTSSPS